MRKHKIKRKHWSKLTSKEAEDRAKFDAGLITFNRGYHRATKFKIVVDYGKIQGQFLTDRQKNDNVT